MISSTDGHTDRDMRMLDDATCVGLLTRSSFGRIAFTSDTWPLILPVNYVYDEPNVLIRTAPGTKLDAAPRTPVGFEIDGADDLGRWGWSVVVQGHAFNITDFDDETSQHLRTHVVDTWAPGERRRWLKITAVNVSGRAFGPIPDTDIA